MADTRPLDPYRVLDLTDHRGQLAGMMLADLGADVIRIEPPRGSDARRHAPFMPGGDGERHSLAFAAYDQGKRSVVIDLADDADRQHFLALVAGADFVIDSGPPALLDQAGLDHETLRAANPRLVHVRVTPFGTDGPRCDAPASDLTIAALGGPVALQGHPDRAPVRLSVPQVWRHVSAEAALAALVGHRRMLTTGEGVFVDVSAQASMVWTLLQAAEASAIQGWDYERAASQLQLGTVGVDLVHPCADGFVVAMALGKMFVDLAPAIAAAGIAVDEYLAREDWATYDRRVFLAGELAIPQAELVGVFHDFFATKTKAELFAIGRELGVTIAPVQTIADLLGFEHLAERHYFTETSLPGGGAPQTPGPFIRSSAFDFVPRSPAPELGTHTAAVLDELTASPRPAAAASVEPSDLPFAGLKVADFSWVGVGPISAKALADHGADVVRIESESHPDVLRGAGPYKDGEPGWNRSHFYGEFNTSKRSIGLDLKNPLAAEVVPAIIEWADVIIESFTPGTIGRLGLDYETVRAANPGAIMVSTCLMGQTGPLASVGGYGYHAAALAGFTALTGDPDRSPTGPWNAYTDTVAPRFLTTALLAAIDHRRRTGEGQYLDVAQLEAALHFLAPEMLAAQATGAVHDRNGNRSPDYAPQGVYPCAGDDEWCAVAVDNAAQWQALCAALDQPTWADDAQLTSVDGRLARHDEIDAAISAWTSERDPQSAMATLLEAGVPAGHVQRSRDLLADPQLAARGFHRRYDHPEMGNVPYAGHQYRISGYDHGPRSAAPLLGGDTFEVLTDDLGFSAEQVVEWMGAGLLE